MPEKVFDLGAEETIETELRFYKKPLEGDRITVRIPAGLCGETREEAITEAMLQALVKELHFGYVYV